MQVTVSLKIDQEAPASLSEKESLIQKVGRAVHNPQRSSERCFKAKSSKIRPACVHQHISTQKLGNRV